MDNSRGRTFGHSSRGALDLREMLDLRGMLDLLDLRGLLDLLDFDDLLDLLDLRGSDRSGITSDRVTDSIGPCLIGHYGAARSGLGARSGVGPDRGMEYVRISRLTRSVDVG